MKQGEAGPVANEGHCRPEGKEVKPLERPTGELADIHKELHALRKGMETLNLALLGNEELGIPGQLKRTGRLEQDVALLKQRDQQRDYMLKGALFMLTLLGIGSFGTFLTQLAQLFGAVPVP